MLKKIAILSSILSVSLNATASDGMEQCANTITCRPGTEVKCTMDGNSAYMFDQATDHLSFTTQATFKIGRVAAWQAQAITHTIGTVDCNYYSWDGKNPNVNILFRSSSWYDATPYPGHDQEWIRDGTALICDQNIHDCLLAVRPLMSSTDIEQTS